MHRLPPYRFLKSFPPDEETVKHDSLPLGRHGAYGQNLNSRSIQAHEVAYGVAPDDAAKLFFMARHGHDALVEALRDSLAIHMRGVRGTTSQNDDATGVA